MLFELQQTLPWLEQYKYLVIFPISIVEGPIITVISGFLSSLGYLNIIAAFFTIWVGDLVGDTIYYSIGRYGRKAFIERWGHYIGINTDRLYKLEKHFDKHSTKTFFIAKFAHGAGSLVLIAGGIAKVKYRHMIVVNAVSTAIKSSILLAVGYYFGQAYMKINAYFNEIALVLFLTFIVLYIVFIKTDIFGKMLDN